MATSASFSVKEEVRINFTKKLHQLREGNEKSMSFPSTLSNIERKFLHKLAEELGLSSKSQGKGDDRFITVSKVESGDDKRSAEILLPKNVTSSLLSSASILESAHRSALASMSNRSKVSNKKFMAKTALRNQVAAISQSYQDAQNKRLSNPQYRTIQFKRKSLPVFEHLESIRSLITENQIVLISGETGCGKTTQVPQYILDDLSVGSSCRIAITQPRRLSAISVAERIADERSETVGGTIGYNIRLESEISEKTQVVFVTPGVLIRKLQTDPLLEEYSHIIIDEAHERDRFTEFLIIIMRDVCSKRRDLKLILMSATLHTKKLSMYFANCPHLHVGVSVFPVQEFFLEDVLRFTDHLSMNKSSSNASRAHSNADRLGLQSKAMMHFYELNQTYSCSICNSSDFKSPEELGTHSAFCFGVQGEARRPSTEKRVSLKGMLAAFESQQGDSHKKKGKVSNKSANNDISQVEVSKAPSAESIESEESDAEFDNVVPTSEVLTEVNVRDESSNAIDNDLLKEYHANWDDSQIDYDLIINTLQYIVTSEYAKIFALANSSDEVSENGSSILIFLPGWDDISKLSRILSNHHFFGDGNKFKVLQLHSGIPKHSQKEIFKPVPKTQHKIILSTNIAETSLTINDVTVVIDTGRMKEKTYDPYVKLSVLKLAWISQAAARQRKGRAGRTCAGVCFHLFSQTRYKHMNEFQDSEILRMPLEEIVLQTKVLNLAPGKGSEENSAQSLLLKALDPPPVLSVQNAVRLLQSIGCLDDEESITVVGSSVAKLPIDPRIARIVLVACLLGCGPALISASTIMAYRDPFLVTTNKEGNDLSHSRDLTNAIKKNLANGIASDQYALLKAMEQYRSVLERFGMHKANVFCDQSNLSRSTMSFLNELITQITHSMREVGVSMSGNNVSNHNGNAALVASLIGMGLYPDVAIRNNVNFVSENGHKMKIHPSSVNFKTAQGKVKDPISDDLRVIGFSDLIAITANNNIPGAASLSMLNTTKVSTFGLLLAAGDVFAVDAEKPEPAAAKPSSVEDSDEEWASATAALNDIHANDDQEVIAVVDEWIKIRLNKRVFEMVSRCREILAHALEVFVVQREAEERQGAAPLLPVEIQRGLDIIAKCLCVTD